MPLIQYIKKLENLKSQRLLRESDNKHGSIITPLANACLCNMIYILPPLPLYRNTQTKTPHTQAFSHTLRHLRQFGAFSNPICQYKEALLVSNVNELNMPSTGMCESRGPGSVCVCVCALIPTFLKELPPPHSLSEHDWHTDSQRRGLSMEHRLAYVCTPPWTTDDTWNLNRLMQCTIKPTIHSWEIYTSITCS